MANGWGRILVGTRQAGRPSENGFLSSWSHLLASGLRKGDAWTIASGMHAHKASNALVRELLRSDKDALFSIDNDADFGPELLNEFRDFEGGWKYDALQAFYLKRTWPPEAVWYKHGREPGKYMKCLVFDPDTTEDVALVGTHCALFRRQIFETMLARHPEVPFEEFDWFYFERHSPNGEDTQLSIEAEALGFRLGATTHIKVNHETKLAIGWEIYQEYLQMTGLTEMVERRSRLVGEVAKFLNLSPEVVSERAGGGVAEARRAWETADPETPDEVRHFYGHAADYLFDLVGWNGSKEYAQVIEPLKKVAGQYVLVVGSGLGSEIDALAEKNVVEAFELPGVLRDFGMQRMNGKVHAWLDGNSLMEAELAWYDLVVMVDVVEHIHPLELEKTMDAVGAALKPGGRLFVHMGSPCPERPMHFDNAAAFVQWAQSSGLERKGEYTWRKI